MRPNNRLRVCIAALLVASSAGCSNTSWPVVQEAAPPSPAVRESAPSLDCLPPEGPVARPEYCSYPADIRAFIDDRDACDHFRSEPWPEPGDDPEWIKERTAQLTEGMKACKGTDNRLHDLKTAYGKDADISRILSEFEENIERSE